MYGDDNEYYWEGIKVFLIYVDDSEMSGVDIYFLFFESYGRKICLYDF